MDKIMIIVALFGMIMGMITGFIAITYYEKMSIKEFCIQYPETVKINSQVLLFIMFALVVTLVLN